MVLDHAETAEALERALQRRLLLVCGKGGVGKSSVAVALARLAASRGQRVLLTAMNAPQPFGGLLPGLAEDGVIACLPSGIEALNMVPTETLREYVLLVVKFQFIYKLIFENQLMRKFLRGIPSLAELMALGKLWYHFNQTEDGGRPRYDLLILDCPATGHGAGLLRLPRKVREATPPGPLQTIARDLEKMLGDSQRTGLVLVALPEETPVNELLELEAAAREEGVAPLLAVCNAFYPALPPRQARPGGIESEPLATLLSAHDAYQRRQALHARQLARLRAGAGTTVLTLPCCFKAEHNPIEPLLSVCQRILAHGGDASFDNWEDS